MKTILELVREKSATIFDHIHENPFVLKIISGELTQAQFEFYSEQDDIYLQAWVTIISKLLNRLRKHSLAQDTAFQEDLDFIQKHLNDVQNMINDGVFFYKKLEADYVASPTIALIEEYINHLETAAKHPTSIALGLTSLLGCYDLYLKIGQHSQQLNLNTEHPYFVWLSNNYDEGFVETAERIFKLTDRITEYEITTGILKDKNHIINTAYQSYCFEQAFFILSAEFQYAHAEGCTP